MVDLARKKPKIIVARVKMSSLSMNNYINERSLQETQNLITRLGWRPLGPGKFADSFKIDQEFRLGYAQVYVQVKGANLNPKYGTWCWEIFPKGTRLPMEFYGEQGNFLALAGLEVTQEPLRLPQEEWARKLHDTKLYHTFIEYATSAVGLLPANAVVNHFKDKSKGTHNIKTTKKAIETGKSWLSKYFGMENVEQLLLKELERQLKEQK